MPRHIFDVTVAYLVILTSVFIVYFTLPWLPAHLPATLGPIPAGIVWFGATGAVVASLYGIFAHNQDWNPGYNYWHPEPTLGRLLNARP